MSVARLLGEKPPCVTLEMRALRRRHKLLMKKHKTKVINQGWTEKAAVPIRRTRNARRERLFEEQKGICYYCKLPTIWSDWTVEHRIPLSRGGNNHRDNIVGACTICNGKKANRTEAEFLRFPVGIGKERQASYYTILKEHSILKLRLNQQEKLRKWGMAEQHGLCNARKRLTHRKYWSPWWQNGPTKMV